MRKALTLALVICTQMIGAQNKLNAFAGANYSMFTRDVARQISGEQSFGLNIGANYELGLSEKIAFRPGITYAEIGDRTKTGWIYGSYSVANIDQELAYLQVPMDFKFWNRIYMVAGPQVGFLVAGTADNSVDFGANLGMGFTIDRFFAEAGIHQGLTPVFKNFGSYSGETSGIHNAYAKVILGYRIL